TASKYSRSFSAISRYVFLIIILPPKLFFYLYPYPPQYPVGYSCFPQFAQSQYMEGKDFYLSPGDFCRQIFHRQLFPLHIYLKSSLAIQMRNKSFCLTVSENFFCMLNQNVISSDITSGTGSFSFLRNFAIRTFCTDFRNNPFCRRKYIFPITVKRFWCGFFSLKTTSLF